MCPTEATLFGRRLQVRAESQQTAIDCEGQWRVARKRRTVALRLRSPRSLPAADKLGASRGNEWRGKKKRGKKGGRGGPPPPTAHPRKGGAPWARPGAEALPRLRLFSPAAR